MITRVQKKKIDKARAIAFRCGLARVTPARWVTHWIQRWGREMTELAGPQLPLSEAHASRK